MTGLMLAVAWAGSTGASYPEDPVGLTRAFVEDDRALLMAFFPEEGAWIRTLADGRHVSIGTPDAAALHPDGYVVIEGNEVQGRSTNGDVRFTVPLARPSLKHNPVRVNDEGLTAVGAGSEVQLLERDGRVRWSRTFDKAVHSVAFFEDTVVIAHWTTVTALALEDGTPKTTWEGGLTYLHPVEGMLYGSRQSKLWLLQPTEAPAMNPCYAIPGVWAALVDAKRRLLFTQEGKVFDVGMCAAPMPVGEIEAEAKVMDVEWDGSAFLVALQNGHVLRLDAELRPVTD